MTIEQIVAQHPCPIIRGKIMERLGISELNLKEWADVSFFAVDWTGTKEGEVFWNAVHGNPTATYSDLKHLDKSYVPEPAKPLPVWRKIDPNNLPIERVAAFEIKNKNLLFVGTLYVDNDFGISIEMYKGANVHGFTHYIPLSDLLNLPTE
jgi:hypothetical protein